MAYAIGQARKLGKQNIKQLENTTDASSAESILSYSYDKLNENNGITSKKSLTTETHSGTIFSLEDKPSEIIQNKYTSDPYSKYMLISNIFVDKDDQFFEIPRKMFLVSLHQEPIFCWFLMMLVHLRIL